MVQSVRLAVTDRSLRAFGGAGDLRVRAMFTFLQKYTAGNPMLINEYMPGGGGRKAANHVYKKVMGADPLPPR